MCETVFFRFGVVNMCCVWDSLCRFGGVIFFRVWERLMWVSGSDFVLCVAAFDVGLG